MQKLKLSWHDFVIYAQEPFDMVVALTSDMKWDDVPPLIQALIRWNNLAGEVSNGGLGQYYFNRVNCGLTLDNLDKDIARHPMMHEEAEIMREVLKRYDDHSKALGLTIESGDWPSEFFDRVSENCKDLEDEISRAEDKFTLKISRQILNSPDYYFDLHENGDIIDSDFTGLIEVKPDPDKKLGKGHLSFRDGYPYGPHTIEYYGLQEHIIIAPNRLAVDVHRRYIDKELSYVTEGTSKHLIKDYLTERMCEKKFSPNGHLEEITNRTIHHLGDRIGDQMEFFPSGLLKDHFIYSHNGIQLERRQYYASGQLRYKHTASRDDKAGAIGTFWPDGTANAKIKGDSSIDNWFFQEVLDENGLTCLDRAGNGEINFASCDKDGEPKTSIADLVNFRFTDQFWKKE